MVFLLISGIPIYFTLLVDAFLQAYLQFDTNHLLPALGGASRRPNITCYQLWAALRAAQISPATSSGRRSAPPEYHLLSREDLKKLGKLEKSKSRGTRGKSGKYE